MRPAIFFTSLGFTEDASMRTTAVFVSACGCGLSVRYSCDEFPNSLNSMTFIILLQSAKCGMCGAQLPKVMSAAERTAVKINPAVLIQGAGHSGQRFEHLSGEAEQVDLLWQRQKPTHPPC